MSLGNSAGQPTGFFHRRPFPHGRPPAQLPTRRQVSITEAKDPLLQYLSTTAKAATALVRAARLYERAIWIADDDPSQSWLSLVSALEIAADQWRGSSDTPSDVLRTNWPELSDLAAQHGDAFHAEVAAVAGPLFKAQQRFVSFVLEFCPDPPDVRPYEFSQVDWGQMDQHLRLIYRYRSSALHGGIPFPVPMCDVPRELDDRRPNERPLGLSTMALDADWVAGDAPMLLWVFEYIARQALLRWRRQLPVGRN